MPPDIPSSGSGHRLLRQGQLYESTAVPEIRYQAQDVAAEVHQLLEARLGTGTGDGTAHLATAV